MVALAQTPESALQFKATKVAAPKVELVTPVGAKLGAFNAAGYEQRTVWSPQDQNVRDLLSKSRLQLDPATMKSLRTLNPSIRQDGTVPAGAKVTYFVPKFDPDKPAPADSMAIVDMASLARYAISPEVADARSVRLQTTQLTLDKYDRQTDFQAHRKLVRDIESAATAVESKAGRMTAKDLALSRYYLSAANAKAATLTTTNFKIFEAQVHSLELSAQPVQGMQVMLKSSGSPFAYRPVVVRVASAQGSPEVGPLRVYVLPSGLVADPETYSEGEIEQYLIDLSFEKLTTPSHSMVAQADMRVWVGPDHSYAGMARLVKQKQPIRFNRLDVSPAGASDRVVDFSAPLDVVRP